MKSYKYILLDWDGNLAKTLDVWLACTRSVLGRYGYHLTDSQIGESFGGFEKYFQALGIEDPDKVVGEIDVIVKGLLPDVELYPDALEVLERLHDGGKKLALITSSSHENTGHLLDKYNLRNFFGAIICGDDTKHHKPHPEPLEKALELLKGTKNEAVMVGDSDKDLGAARNAGIDSILFYPPEHQKFYDIAELKKLNPTHTIDDFRHILNLAEIQN